MMRNYPGGFLLTLVGLTLAHLALVAFGIIPVSMYKAILGDVIVLFIFLTCIPIVERASKKGKDAFVNGFMILTTVQMLSGIAVLAAFAYAKQPGYRLFTIQLAGVFVLFLAVQAIFLVRKVNQ